MGRECPESSSLRAGRTAKSTEPDQTEHQREPISTVTESGRSTEAIDVDCMRLYPDPAASVLVKGIADFYQLQEDQVFVGVGSDDVLAMIFMTFFQF